MYDAIEFLAYLVAFWRFALSPWEWHAWEARFRRSDLLGRCGMLLESTICALCGLLPISGLAILLRATS